MDRWINGLGTDAGLWRAWRAGSASAFEALYRRHKDRLYRFIYRGCGEATAAEELAQEVWMAVIAAGNGDADLRFKSWLFTIAARRLADFWRHRYRAPASVEWTDREVDEPADDPLLADRFRAELLRQLDQLPDSQRIALLLRCEGFSQIEIARIAGVGEETVKSRIRYGRKQMRLQVGELE